jgi:TRAP-type mannitol/chloroaromatic compound transport system permease small subunit
LSDANIDSDAARRPSAPSDEAVDPVDPLEEVHEDQQVNEEGAPRAGLIGRLHPIGWVAIAFAALALIAGAAGWDLLIARMPWWLWAITAATIVLAALPSVLHRLRLVIEAVSTAMGKVVIVLAWLIFFIQLFNVITRYTNDWFERDILFGETTSLAWMSFAALFIFGVSYGVKEGINPRIDFWWAEFSIRRKAWIDFTLHTFLFLPFLIVGLRVLKPYAARSLGYNRFANGGEGSWPDGWRVWNTWETSTDAGQLPQGPIQALILVGFVLWTAQVVAEIIKTGFVINGRDDLGDISDSGEAPQRIE